VTENSQQAFYDQYWKEGVGTYSGDRQGYAPFFRRFMRAHFSGLSAGSPLLEIGCGDASFTKDLLVYSNHVTGLDISPAQVEANRKKLPSINFLSHDLALPLPFPDASFQGIWCSEVLEHLFDPALVLRETARILRPGGLLLVTVPYHGLVKNVAIALLAWDHHFDPEYPHVRFFTKNTLGNLARKAGFQKIEMSWCGMGKPFRDLFWPTNLLMRAEKK
jgi:SAM-dependent methyltransferase